jgi:hypothetical protein
MTIFIAFAAIVVDLGTLRLDRRVDRAGADAAAAAAAAYLRPGDTRDPKRACERAWAYLAANIAGLGGSGAAGACAGFAPYRGDTGCPTAQMDESGTVGDFQVTVSWPVPDGSALLTEPDLRPGSVDPPVPDLLFDGDPAGCERIGVTVTRARSFVLGPAIGATGASTTVHSVALAAPPGGDDEIAALVALNDSRLGTLCARAGGSLVVGSYLDGTPRPGIIAVDSDGTDTTTSCSGADDYVIAADSQPGTRICADGIAAGLGCDGGGFIGEYAKGPYGDAARAHDPAAPLSPLPVGVAERIGTAPVEGRYGGHIEALRARLGGPGEPGGFTVLRDGQDIPGTTPPEPFRCRADTPMFVPSGSWFVDCDDFEAAADVVFGGGRIVFDGTVTAAGGGCLAVNVPLSLPPGGAVPCPAVIGSGTAAATTQPPPLSDARVFVRGRSGSPGLVKDGSATLLLPRTFVYLQDGSLAIRGGGGGLLWTHARATSCAPGDEDCLASRFHKLTFWGRDGGTHQIETQDPGALGGSRLDLTGVLFAPDAHLRLSGDDEATLRAQLWADSIEVTGPAQLTWSPDPASAVATQRSSIRLIR